MTYRLMPNSTFNLGDFVSEVATRGMAKPNRYEVIITPPPCVLNFNTNQSLSAQNTSGAYTTQKNLGPRVPARVSVFCEQAQLPPSRIITSQQRIFGPPSFHPQAADYGGDNFSLTFGLDKWYTIKEFFDTWIDGIVSRETNTAYYQSNYLTTMTVSQLDEEDRRHYTAAFEDVFPIAVNPIQLGADMNNQVSKLVVTFCYRRWRSVSMTVAPRDENIVVPTPEQRKTSSNANPTGIRGGSGVETSPGVRGVVQPNI